MMFRLYAFFHADRALPGRAHLIGKRGELVDSFGILGKADNAKAMAKGNPSRDPLRPYGDTPTGVYEPVRLVDFGDAELAKGTAVGSRWFPLVGASGDAAVACGPELMPGVAGRIVGGRTGLGLHAGRAGDRLFPTYGCLRLLESDLEDLCTYVGSELLEVTVVIL